MDVQKKIKENVENFRCIINEMSNWEKDMKRKEKSLLQSEDSSSYDDLPPVRAKLRKEEKDSCNEKVVKFGNCDPTNGRISREKSLVEKDLGNEFIKEKKWTDAIHHFSAAIDYYAVDPVFFCSRALCYLQSKQWTNALVDCNQALELDPNYIEAYYRKGLALKELNKFGDARLNLRKAFELERTDRNLKNDILSLYDELSAANTTDFDDNLTSNQKKEKAFFEKERGNASVARKKWNEAIRHYTEAIKCYSQDPTFYCNRALCFLHVQKFKEAETDCTIALQLDPDYVKAYHRRGLALKELNQLKEALENFNKARNLNPKNTCIFKDILKLEKLIDDQSSFKLSLETKFKDAKASDKELAYSEKEKGNLFVQKKDWKSAIECYTEACRLYHDDISFNLNRALCFLKMKEPKKALLDCTFVLERDPNNVKAYFRRAEAHESLNNLSKAHDDLLAAFKLDPSDNTIQSRLTRLEKKMGILPPETSKNENDCTNIINEPVIKSVLAKRLSGEKFIKLGGYFMQPAKKLPHQASTKPLKTVKIADKNEDPLKSAFDEISVTEINVSNYELKKSQNGKCLGSVETDILKSNENEENTSVNISELPIPKTSMQFLFSWDKLISSESQYLYLKRIHGDDLPNIFKESLESYVFSDIIEILATEFVRASEPVYSYLLGLSRVKRIKALLLFASEEDNTRIKALFSHVQKMNEVSESELNSLKSFYYC